MSGESEESVKIRWVIGRLKRKKIKSWEGSNEREPRTVLQAQRGGAAIRIKHASSLMEG